MSVLFVLLHDIKMLVTINVNLPTCKNHKQFLLFLNRECQSLKRTFVIFIYKSYPVPNAFFMSRALNSEELGIVFV